VELWWNGDTLMRFARLIRGYKDSDIDLDALVSNFSAQMTVQASSWDALLSRPDMAEIAAV
jgi:hypothetical protein